MMGGVFISYRRADGAAEAGRLNDHLERVFDPDTVFMDVDGLEPGIDFGAELRRRVEASAVVLVVMGPRWAELEGEDGRPRLFEPNDYVRIEVEIALAMNRRVIPVLLDGASMPRAEVLPDSLRPLCTRNAVSLRHARFRDDAAVLSGFLQRFLGTEAHAPETEAPASVYEHDESAAEEGDTLSGDAIVFEVPPARVPSGFLGGLLGGGDRTPVPDPDPFAIYLAPEHAERFIILETAEGCFVQFVAHPEDDDAVLFDVPVAGMNADQQELARIFFGTLQQTIQVAEDEVSYTVSLPRDAGVMAQYVYSIFEAVYGYPSPPALTVTIDG